MDNVPVGSIRLLLPSPSGELEVLSNGVRTSSERPPLLLIHGAFCSAIDYANFLDLFATHGFPAYSMSLRGHGSSWCPSWTRMMFLTTQSHYAADIRTVAQFIQEQHSDSPPPIFIGHSFGGAMAQHVLSQGLPASGLVLLAAAPLSGGNKQIMENWQQIEAPAGYTRPWSPRQQLDTTDQVRKVFFCDETPETVIQSWLNQCKTKVESARAGLSGFWPFGSAENVLQSIVSHKKILFVSATNDVLVTSSMVLDNYEAYKSQAEMKQLAITSIQKGGHHIMMDIGWKDCTRAILDWLEGRNVESHY